MSVKTSGGIDSTVLLVSIIVIAALLTWIVPPGSYERTTLEISGVGERQAIIPGTYARLAEKTPQGPGEVLMAPYKGLVEAADIIAFILIVGGAFGVLMGTRAVSAGLHQLIAYSAANPRFEQALIPFLIVLFSLAGASYGMAEEIIPLTLVTVHLARALGYDALVGVAIPLVGSQVGFAAAPLNPFTVGIAQGIAGVPLFSGQAFRWTLWLVATLLALGFILQYARRIKKDPTRSALYGVNSFNSDNPQATVADPGLTRRHKFILVTFLSGICVMVAGVVVWRWYIEEIAGLFLLLGVLIGFIDRMKPREISASFMAGAGTLLNAAIVIGLARAVLVVIRDGQIMDTMLNSIAAAIGGGNPLFAAELMFMAQTLINFVVPSGSGQAALTMPLMAPLADLAGIARQTAVLAFQLGDGFSNMIVPTNAALLAVLNLGKITFRQWFLWIIQFQLLLMLLSVATIAVAVFIGWGGDI